MTSVGGFAAFVWANDTETAASKTKMDGTRITASTQTLF